VNVSTLQDPLLDFTLKVLPFHQLRYIVIVLLFRLSALSSVFLLHALVALRQLSQAGERVWAELVQDTRYEFGKFFIFAGAVYGKGVGGDGCVNCEQMLRLGQDLCNEGPYLWAQQSG